LPGGRINHEEEWVTPPDPPRVVVDNFIDQTTDTAMNSKLMESCVVVVDQGTKTSKQAHATRQMSRKIKRKQVKQPVRISIETIPFLV
jgi:hypothetical protein